MKEVIRTVYITSDGREFHSKKKAQEYEDSITVLQSEALKHSLGIYLANYSQLKAGLIRRDKERLEEAWKRYRNALPKKMTDFSNNQIVAELKDATNRLIVAAQVYEGDLKALEVARDMIPRLNKALKDGPDFYPQDILSEPKKVKYEW